MVAYAVALEANLCGDSRALCLVIKIIIIIDSITVHDIQWLLLPQKDRAALFA